MSNLGEFFAELVNPFFGGILNIFKGIFDGIVSIFNVFNYFDVISDYKLVGGNVAVAVLGILVIFGLLGLLIFLIYKLVRLITKFRKNIKKEDSYLEEIEVLTNEVVKLKEMNPNGNIKVSNENGKVTNNITNIGKGRFYKLSEVDKEFEGKEINKVENTFTLEEFCNNFRNYSASKLHLYYDLKTIRLFVASLCSNKLIILEGISGTGKTSLAYAFGKMVENKITVASVQPSWRDSTEIFGYFNEFTKKFNETDVLTKMYEAMYTDDVYVTLLDEMNISRVEYYFAEMLSVLELPNKEDWNIELVPSVWPDDPVKLTEGKIKIPENMWYIGTINNDDSTFMVTDKVYDRAMPISIDDRFEAFEAPVTDSIKVSFEHLNNLFEKACQEHKVSEENMNKIKDVERYIIDHFRLAFGNRIVKQLTFFVPAFVACGGDEVEGIDYIVAHKILRKFEQLNLAYIKDEIDGFINYLDELYGKDKMSECKAYLLRLKKMI